MDRPLIRLALRRAPSLAFGPYLVAGALVVAGVGS